MNCRFLLIAVLAGCLCAATAHAGKSSPFFSSRTESKIVSAQDMAETLFQRGEYKRALIIYEHDLVPLGDKYAQYMIGFMHLIGAGVPEDAVVASAWYRLAAERGYPQFIAERDRLLRRFTPVDLVKSDEEYRKLRRKYSDLVILARLVREDVEAYRTLTGSRIDSSGAVTIVDPRSGLIVSGNQLETRVRKRVEECLELMNALMEGVQIDADMDRIDLGEIDEIVAEQVALVNDR